MTVENLVVIVQAGSAHVFTSDGAGHVDQVAQVKVSADFTAARAAALALGLADVIGAAGQSVVVRAPRPPRPASLPRANASGPGISGLMAWVTGPDAPAVFGAEDLQQVWPVLTRKQASNHLHHLFARGALVRDGVGLYRLDPDAPPITVRGKGKPKGGRGGPRRAGSPSTDEVHDWVRSLPAGTSFGTAELFAAFPGRFISRKEAGNRMLGLKQRQAIEQTGAIGQWRLVDPEG